MTDTIESLQATVADLEEELRDLREIRDNLVKALEDIQYITRKYC